MKSAMIFLGLVGSVTGATVVQLGQSMPTARRYYSENGNGMIEFQNDGNLVVSRALQNGQQALWSSQSNAGQNSTAALQSDGNFVIYDIFGSPKFDTRTAGKGVTLSIQDDCNAVISDLNGHAVWASGTAGC